MMKKISLHWQVIIAMGLGLFYSWLSLSNGYGEFTDTWLSPFGDIFIRLLKLLAVPIVLFSIISGVSSLVEAKGLGKLAMRSIGLYFLTTLIAIGLGIFLVNTLSPGTKVGKEMLKKNRLHYELFAKEKGKEMIGASIWDKPENKTLVQQILAENQEKNVQPDRFMQLAEQSKSKTGLQYVVDMIPENIIVALSDARSMLQVIFFALFFGVCILLLPREKTAPVVDFIEGFNSILIKMIQTVMEFAPFFVFCLMAGTFTQMTNSTAELFDIFSTLGWYAFVVVSGFVLMLFAIYPILVTLLGRGFSAKQYLSGIKEAQLVAFSTSSSVATLPVTLRCAIEKLGVSKKVANFVIPIGATINMNGSAIYQAIAVLFLAQLHGIDLTWELQSVIVLTTLLASVGTSGIPSGAFILLIVLLDMVGLDPYWIAIITPVDRLLDMCLTVVNITGDMAVATVVQRYELAPVELKENELN